MAPRKHILIVGAGPGGLTAAMLLAHRGFRVTILEKEDRVGGRNAELRAGDYSFDTGPTFLHQKFTLDEMFAETGRRAEDYMDFVALDPMTRLSWGGTSLNTFSDQGRMHDEIERVFPGNGAGFRRYMSEQADKLRTIFPCLQRPYHKLSAYFSPTLMKALPHVLTRKTVYDILTEYFDDERLRLAFTFQAKYLGMSPWKCPGLFSILSFIEYRFGIHHVQGGLCRISQGMARVVEELGGEIRLSTPVKRLITSGRRMTGAVLESGEQISADAVLVNADYAHAFTRMLGDQSITDAQMQRKKFSCSTFMLYLGVDKIYPDEPHHHILFSGDYRANVADIASERKVSEDLSIYVRNSSINDPHVAPPGHSGLYVLVPTINTRHVQDWDSFKGEVRQRVLNAIVQRTGMKDLRSHIVEERILTPADWASSGVYMGATFNLAHTLDQMLYLRPHNRLRGFENCYLAGGGTHPGSGLPTIYESARISANLICDSFQTRYQTSDLASEILRCA